MRNGLYERGLGSAAIEYCLVVAVVALPAFAAFAGFDSFMNSIYANVLGNVSGVVDTLVR